MFMKELFDKKGVRVTHGDLLSMANSTEQKEHDPHDRSFQSLVSEKKVKFQNYIFILHRQHMSERVDVKSNIILLIPTCMYQYYLYF